MYKSHECCYYIRFSLSDYIYPVARYHFRWFHTAIVLTSSSISWVQNYNGKFTQVDTKINYLLDFPTHTEILLNSIMNLLLALFTDVIGGKHHIFTRYQEHCLLILIINMQAVLKGMITPIKLWRKLWLQWAIQRLTTEAVFLQCCPKCFILRIRQHGKIVAQHRKCASKNKKKVRSWKQTERKQGWDNSVLMTTLSGVSDCYNLYKQELWYIRLVWNHYLWWFHKFIFMLNISMYC